MPRETYVFRDGKLIPKHLAPPIVTRLGHGPMVISDSMDGVLNHADGKRYDSKSAYYRAVRQAGCEIMGNDPAATRAPEYKPVGGVAADLKRTMGIE